MISNCLSAVIPEVNGEKILNLAAATDGLVFDDSALAEVKDADLSKLIIYDEIQSPLVQLYLYDGKNWVEQKLAEEIPNPKKYIDEDGRLFIQFRAVGNASEYMEVTTPVLMLEGRAK